MIEVNSFYVCVLIVLESVEELCAIDLYEADTRDSHASMHLLLSACKQLHQSGLLNSVLHSQVHTAQMNVIVILLSLRNSYIDLGWDVYNFSVGCWFRSLSGFQTSH